MFDRLEILQTAQAMAAHAALRQNAVAANIANADTPGYAARDAAPFAEVYRAGATPMQATRPGHLGAEEAFRAEVRTRAEPGTRAPNGNSVSLEGEMVKAVEVRRQHDLALAIYRSSLGILRTSLGRAR